VTGSGEKPSPDPGVFVVLSQKKGTLASHRNPWCCAMSRDVKCFHSLSDKANVALGPRPRGPRQVQDLELGCIAGNKDGAHACGTDGVLDAGF
jgi:hypothetical protein